MAAMDQLVGHKGTQSATLALASQQVGISAIIEWTEGRYTGVEQEIPIRCILGGVDSLTGGEEITVKMGKSAGARKWKAIFL